MTRADVLERLAAKALTLARMEAEGTIARGCPARSCVERYAADRPELVPGERHTPSRRCESGRRLHCVCGVCY